MPDRSAISQVVQYGSEVTPGTAVAATGQLQSIAIEPGEAVDMQVFRPTGQKFPSIITPGKEFVEFDVSGVPSYSELAILFNGICHDTTPTTVETTGRFWQWQPQARSADTVQTYTFEQGDSVRAHKFAYGLFTEVGISYSRDGLEVSGAGIGQAISDGITMTASPTALEEKPVLPTQASVYLDTTSAAVGTTKLLRVLSAEFTIGDRFNPLWVLNSALGSYAAHVETVPTVEVKLMVEADAQGMALLPIMRAGTTRYIGISCISTELAGATTLPYMFNVYVAGKVSDVGKFSDEDGVFAIEWTLTATYDPAWNRAFSIDLRNKTAVTYAPPP